MKKKSKDTAEAQRTQSSQGNMNEKQIALTQRPLCSLRTLWLLALPLIAGGCIEHHVKTEPIHVTVDVNLKVDRQLDQFFAFEKNPAGEQAKPQ